MSDSIVRRLAERESAGWADHPATSPSLPGVEAIRARALRIHLARLASGQPGDALSDWFQAERELKAEFQRRG